MELRVLGMRLIALNMLRRSLTHEKTADCKLYHGQLPLLETLLRFPCSTQQELAELLRVTPASVALSTKRLQKAGLIEKAADEADRRRNRLVVTNAGREAANVYRRCFDEVDAATFAGFTEEEQRVMLSLFDRMLSNLGAEDYTKNAPPFWKGELPK